MMTRSSFIVILSTVCMSAAFMSTNDVHASDWPMWRRDSGRTSVTEDVVPEALELKWTRELPPIEPAFHSSRLQFDAGYEPIVADGKLLLASSRNDSVTAYDATTGRELWVFRTNGPIRFAPAVWEESVCFGSDDGHLYCVELSTGDLKWKYRAVPSERRLLGNRRLISVWPVRGGPVVSEGTVYFAAGVWPFEGVFVYAMDIASGKVIWRNERLGHIFGQQPHNTQAIGGLAPQGYLIVNDDELIVPCSTAYPARLNIADGTLLEFQLPAPGRFPGGWFAAIDKETSLAVRRGKLTFDKAVNQQLHEDKVNAGHGVSGISRLIKTGKRTLNFDDPLKGVDGKIHSMIFAENKLFVSTAAGKIYCFGEQAGTVSTKVTHWNKKRVELSESEKTKEYASRLIQESGHQDGVAIVVGLSDGNLVKSLLKNSRYQIIAFDDNATKVEQLRVALQQAGIPGERAAVIQADLKNLSLPQYLATLITTESPDRTQDMATELLQSLRPFGGIAVLGNNKIDTHNLNETTLGKFESGELNGQQVVRRVGALPGSVDYQGNYALSEDALVRFPLGVLWFDDTLAHFKRSPQPEFKGGVMISRPKDWSKERVRGDYSVDYPLLGPVLSDIYTGRVLDASEESKLRASLPDVGRENPQQSYYHAPHQKTALHPEPPVAGQRVNPMTGKSELRVFPKTYGCDGGVDYGMFYTLRSGTPAFYDKTLESGTVFISGPRSGCTNSIIPSGGILNVPYFYEGCTCSYPLPTALSLVAMPESFEQWASWGEDTVEPGSIQRIGINFGAPGDRTTRDATLWLDYPSVGGPSPKIRTKTIPENPDFHYRHSLWMNKDSVFPWIAASSVEGLQRFELEDLSPGAYTVRLYFSEGSTLTPGDRVQQIKINGQVVLNEFDIRKTAGDSMKEVVKQIENIQLDGSFSMTLNATHGKTLISGVELIRSE
ncbi:PQQ-binding-like beta-propeller repeat protein [Thalassoglobus sp.]|uniref:outer membrane protein assembly factor BamB family protein n=1 Tax=Thalassoglobus sp. TaxID=2795869 RepID=UPI003AA83BC8